MFEAESIEEKMEVSDENIQGKAGEPVELSKGEKKRVRLTICFTPEEDREKKKKVPKG